MVIFLIAENRSRKPSNFEFCPTVDLGSPQNRINKVDLDIYIIILSPQKRINIIQLLVPLTILQTVNPVNTTKDC